MHYLPKFAQLMCKYNYPLNIKNTALIAQFEGADKRYTVKADIEYGHGNVVPLWAFGLNY